jgi:murein DD-endopeptidase MepM/ murein hydrolase activator NlpD
MKSLRFYWLSALAAGIVLFSGFASAGQSIFTTPAVGPTLRLAQAPQLVDVPPAVIAAGETAPLPQGNCPSLGDEAYLYTESACVEAREVTRNPVSETPNAAPEVAVLEGETPWYSGSRRRPKLEARDRPIPAADDRTTIARQPRDSQRLVPQDHRSPRFPTRLEIKEPNDEVTPWLASQLVAPLEPVPNRVTLLGVLCKTFVTQEQEFAPVQLVDTGPPSRSKQLTWVIPAESTYIAPFSGVDGSPAGHEGTDYVHVDPGVTDVPVVAAAAGRVVYVRAGCPQSRMFGANRERRECGAGWGDHVVVDHGEGLLSRYAHLAPESVTARVGDQVTAGKVLGQMGNTGRSDTRHLHFEVGFAARALDACAPAQSFDWVYNPTVFGV